MASASNFERKLQREKPKLSLLQLKPLALSTITEDNSPCETPQSTVSWINTPEYIQDTESDIDASGYNYMLPSACIFKLMQVIVIIVCIILYSEGMKQVSHSIESQLFTQIICLDYLIITPIILFSYLLGKRMPELLIRIFNLLGGILFLVAGAVILQSYQSYITFNVYDKDDDSYDSTTMRQGVFLLATGILCFINSALYFADVAWSIHTTLASL